MAARRDPRAGVVVEVEGARRWMPLGAKALEEVTRWLVVRVAPPCRRFTIHLREGRQRAGTDCLGQIWLQFRRGLRHRFEAVKTIELVAHEVGHHQKKTDPILRWSAGPGAYTGALNDCLWAVRAESLAVPAAAHLLEAGHHLPGLTPDSLEAVIDWANERDAADTVLAVDWLAGMGDGEPPGMDPEQLARLLVLLLASPSGDRMVIARRVRSTELALARARVMAMVGAAGQRESMPGNKRTMGVP